MNKIVGSEVYSNEVAMNVHWESILRLDDQYQHANFVYNQICESIDIAY